MRRLAVKGEGDVENIASDVQISLATAKDVDELLGLYAAVQEAVAGTDNDPQWIVGVHPSREQLEAAIRAGELIVGRLDGRLAAALIANAEGAEGYEAVPWTVDAKPGEYGVIHLFGVHPAFRGRGLARPLMAAAEDAGRRRGWKALRLDTLVDNYGAQRTYERLGFSCLGPVHLTYGSYVDTEEPRFVMYERAIG